MKRYLNSIQKGPMPSLSESRSSLKKPVSKRLY